MDIDSSDSMDDCVKGSTGKRIDNSGNEHKPKKDGKSATKSLLGEIKGIHRAVENIDGIPRPNSATLGGISEHAHISLDDGLIAEPRSLGIDIAYKRMKVQSAANKRDVARVRTDCLGSRTLPQITSTRR